MTSMWFSKGRRYCLQVENNRGDDVQDQKTDTPPVIEGVEIVVEVSDNSFSEYFKY